MSSPTGNPITPLRRSINLRETVLEQLRTAIITGELVEGTLVSAPMLGQALGVSATPVREAMMDLTREGLVETVKNKGFRVTQMSANDLDDLTAIRLLLEPPAMLAVAGTLTPVQLEELRTLADTCFGAAEAGDLVQYLRSDREFHARVLSYTGNRQLVELATTLRVRTRMYGIATLAEHGRLAVSAAEHHTLITALENGNGAEAERLLREHIGHARKSWATGQSE